MFGVGDGSIKCLSHDSNDAVLTQCVLGHWGMKCRLFLIFLVHLDLAWEEAGPVRCANAVPIHCLLLASARPVSLNSHEMEPGGRTEGGGACAPAREKN